MTFNFKNFLRKFARKIFYHTPPETIQVRKKNFIGKQVKLINCGDLNKEKIFYIIQRYGGEGALFSDVTYVVNHLKVADDYGFIPIVDMENFPRWYNEKNY